MPHATNALDGSRVYFEDDDGEGVPLVLHGGFGESIELVRGSPVAQGIPADEFRHIYVDHRGHGRSDKPHDPAEYVMPLRVADAVAVLDELGIERAHYTSVPPTMTTRLTLDPETPALQGHYDPLRRAFSNLVRNAVEACGGEGELEIFAAPVGGGARVTIRDHGPGIPPELEGRIFDPYCTGKEGGTGLGLALAKQTIELHQGTIAVERTRGGGATFVVRLRGL